MEGTYTLLALGFLLLAPATVHAYIDPSAGQSLIQILLAVIAAGGVFLKLFYRWVADFFSRSSKSQNQSGGGERRPPAKLGD